MQIYVCVKHVPDTAANIRVVGGDAFDESCKFVMNPYDEYGVEEALQIIKREGKEEVIIVTVGKESSIATIRSALAMGANGNLYGGESVYVNDRIVGRIRTGNYGYSVGKDIGLVYLPLDLAEAGPRLEVEVLGERVSAQAAETPLVDPKGEKLRA